MAVAVSKTWQLASGESLYVGYSEAPSWLPAVGTIGNVSLNTIFDVKGSDSSTGAIFNAWSGCAWAPWWGEYGSMVFSGGGHGDGSENTVYRFDIGTRLVSKIKSAAPVFVHGDGQIADSVTGWMWSATTGTGLQVGEPFASHFYSHLLALPETTMPGLGASNGWLYMPGHAVMPGSGQTGTWQACRLRLGLDQQYTHQGPNDGYTPEYGWAVHDTLRNRVWFQPSSNTDKVRWRDLTNNTVGSVTTAYHGGSYYCIGAYHPIRDRIMSIRNAAGETGLHVFNPNDNTWTQATVSGTQPSGNDGAWAWSDTWNCWVCYPGTGGNVIHFLKPNDPTNLTGTWTYTSQTFTGTAVSTGVNPAYNRLRHASKLGNVLLWAAQPNQPIQAIRVNAP